MWNERLEYLIHKDGVQKLKESKVLVVGVGGVGSFAAEGLARSGIGTLILVDHDVIDETNINRQIHALHTTVGQKKTEAMKERILQINPECNVITYPVFVEEGNLPELVRDVDFIVDAIDVVKSKLDLIQYAQSHEIPILSSLGMANRFDPTKIEITSLHKTEGDPLARAIRQQARKRGMDLHIPVLLSKEVPYIQNEVINENGETRKAKYPPASTAFVPSAAGLTAASYVVRYLLGKL
ncbi:MAG: tRNA threonylcarbamoyladenosine dehydratase [Erysipelotrichaceae bacterium]|nr:tRNA threonylcarbamoyladenosine dehydratase [Erysipelotrichaceae bacterium]